MVQMPEEWKGGIDLSTLGRNAAAQEKGAFTEYGYIVESGDEWERQFLSLIHILFLPTTAALTNRIYTA